MRKILPFEEANQVLTPYYETMKDGLTNSFGDVLRAKNFFMESGLFVLMKARTKGSLINDCMKTRMTEAFHGNPDVQVLESGGVFGLLVKEQIFIRFNKMDDGFGTAISKTRRYWEYYNQSAEIEGLPPSAMVVWCGYIPDRGWTEIKGYFLVCFKGGLNWYYDLNENAVQQLSIDLTEKKPRRITPKKKDRDTKTGEEQTGTNDQ